jgi:mannonate dehydratase
MSENVYDAIREFVRRRKVFYVHFRNVNRSVPKFHETFIDEGYVDMLKAMRIYKEEGFDGFFIDDHVPHMIDDTPYGHRGRAYAMGYIKALLHAVGAE